MTQTTYIDGDVLMYRAAFAAEIVHWGCVEPDGECYVVASSRKRAQDLIDNNEYLNGCTVERVVEPMPFSCAIEKYEQDLYNIHKGTNCDNYKVFLTHEDRDKCDRYKWATSYPYKGNRKSMAPPVHKAAVYEYMVSKGAEVVQGIEADDALGYSVFNDANGVCASIDKDLYMVPGVHYDLSRGTLTTADDPGSLELRQLSYGKKLRGTGFKWFCAQMLMGDPVDNIMGLSGYGDVKAHKVLNATELEGNMWTLVKNHYTMAGEDGERLYENASLLWIQRNKGESFTDWIGENL